MSRIGKQPIQIPDGVTVNVTDRVLTAKSSKGELKVPFSENIKVTVDGPIITISYV